MQFIDEKKEIEANKVYDRSSDYYQYTITFAKQWADLMEEKINQEDSTDAVEKYAYELRFKTKNDDITGNMFTYAVLYLAEYWAYGKELKEWHNKKYGNKDVEGVIHSSMIKIQL